jgi:hypothetical protein
MTVPARKRLAASPTSVPARKPSRRQRPIPLTTSRPELIVNGSDREFRELVHNLFGFFALHERIRNGHA